MFKEIADFRLFLFDVYKRFNGRQILKHLDRNVFEFFLYCLSLANPPFVRVELFQTWPDQSYSHPLSTLGKPWL